MRELDAVIRSKSTTRKTSHHTHYGYAVKGVAPRIRARSSCLKSACAEAVQRCDGLAGSVARYAPLRRACSNYVSASKAPHLAGDIAFEGDVVVVLGSERQRWTETVGIDDSLSRVLVTTAVSVLTDREWLA